MCHIDVFTKKGYKTPFKKKPMICEDYVYGHLDPDGVSIVALSDGCTSSRNTDIGARLLVHNAITYIKKTIGNIAHFGMQNEETYYNVTRDYVIQTSNHQRINMGLHESCLDATLLLMFMYKDTIWVFAYGDGLIYIRFKNGTRSLTQIIPDNNAPNYMSYHLDGSRYIDFLGANKGNLMRRTKFGPNHDKPIEQEDQLNHEYPLMYVFNKSSISELILFSDGVESFDDIPTIEVVDSLTSFKFTHGTFIRRKANKVFNGYEKDGANINRDDVAIGGISIA